MKVGTGSQAGIIVSPTLLHLLDPATKQFKETAMKQFFIDNRRTEVVIVRRPELKLIIFLWKLQGGDDEEEDRKKGTAKGAC